MAARPGILPSVLFFVLALLAGPARAGLCDAAFMHEGGVAQYTGKGGLALNADLAFSEVSRQGEGECRARVRGSATFIYMGLPTGKSRLDYLMTVSKGKATFVRYERAGEKPGGESRFDLNMLGLFSYDKISGQGQRLPAQAYRIGPDPDAPGGASPGTTVRIGEKRVGARKTISTALGSQSCWPITYSRNSDATTVAVKGLVLPIPAINTTVTDWYCPRINLVALQEIDQGGVKSTVELTQVK